MATTKKPAAPTKTYTVTGPISVGKGETLLPADPEQGREADTIDLTDEEAAHLVGYVQPVPEKAAAK